MSSRPSRDDAAGVAYLDLRQLAHSTNRPTDELLQLYALEGFLDRLAESRHRTDLILKGGVLLAAFGVRRPTRDIDFAATHPLADAELVGDVINEVLNVERPDGLEFDTSSTVTEPIRSNDPYPSTRVRVSGRLASAKIRFHIDVNVGDPLSPKPGPTEVPRLLGGLPITVIGYSRELVLAEKIVTAIQRGTANTRWRDFVDIATLATQPVDDQVLQSSIAQVAAYRQAQLRPLAETLAGFAELAQVRWEAWRRKQRLDDAPQSFDEVLNRVIDFADPQITAAQSL